LFLAFAYCPGRYRRAKWAAQAQVSDSMRALVRRMAGAG
jgi:hypothetical protein